ncbi:MAG: VOC family protein, partial [Candidatus Dadabacteria bacterium]|nr:VOC family protein [Candidatus Dadabacteria bacterium]
MKDLIETGKLLVLFPLTSALHKVKLDKELSYNRNGGVMIVNLNCVVIHVTDLDAAHGFYGGILGLELKDQKSDYFSYRCHGVEVGLELGAVPRIDRWAPEVYFLVDDVNDWPDKLTRSGVEILKPLRNEEWGGRVVTIADPDGNVIHLCQFGVSDK